MFITNPALLPKVRSEKLMASFRDMPCAARVSSLYPGHSCSAPETTVGCHTSAFGKSMASKTTDLAVIAGCYNCHCIIDGPDRKRRDFILNNYPTAYVERLRQAMIETQARWIDMGLLVVPDGRIV